MEKKITVGIADMKVSKDPTATLVTHALGSCLGIVIYDPVAKVGGMLHAMLPEASKNHGGNSDNPYKYVDTGIPRLFKDAYKLGAEKRRLKVSVTGGARILDNADVFGIGKRNLAIMRKVFWKNGIMIDKEHVEGTISRTVRLNIQDGTIAIKLGGRKDIVL